MSIGRSLDIRLAEGALAVFRADSDAVGYWTSRMYLGPPEGDAVNIVLPQLTVTPERTLSNPGTGGVNEADLSVLVQTFESYDLRFLREGEITPVCRLRHLQKLLRDGTDASGKIVDPDNPTAVSNVTKYLVNNAPRFAPWGAGVLVNSSGGPVALKFFFVATWATRIDNDTFERA